MRPRCMWSASARLRTGRSRVAAALELACMLGSLCLGDETAMSATTRRADASPAEGRRPPGRRPVACGPLVRDGDEVQRVAAPLHRPLSHVADALDVVLVVEHARLEQR